MKNSHTPNSPMGIVQDQESSLNEYFMGSCSHSESGFCILQFTVPVSRSCPGFTISAMTTSSSPRARFAGNRPQSTCGFTFRMATEEGLCTEFSMSILSDKGEPSCILVIEKEFRL